MGSRAAASVLASWVKLPWSPAVRARRANSVGVSHGRRITPSVSTASTLSVQAARTRSLNSVVLRRRR
jgi:hypothetical protein